MGEEHGRKEPALIPNEVLNSVFDDLEQLPGVNLDEDTRDLSLPGSADQV